MVESFGQHAIGIGNFRIARRDAFEGADAADRLAGFDAAAAERIAALVVTADHADDATIKPQRCGFGGGNCSGDVSRWRGFRETARFDARQPKKFL